MGLRSILSLPAVYRAFTGSVAARDFRQVYVNEHVRPRAGDRVLDIGCGPADILRYLPEVEYVGIDISPRYIAAARARYGSRGTFACQPVEEFVVDRAGCYDLVLATGVVHHLDDAAAAQLFRAARTALRPGGRLVTIDGCFVAGQSRAARFLLSRDRGQFVRPLEEYLRLAREAFPDVEPCVRHDLLRIPFTHLILECTNPL